MATENSKPETAFMALLDQYAALIASRELSFDEIVGYLTAIENNTTFLQPGQRFRTIKDLASAIRAALIEKQNNELKQLAARVPAPTPTEARTPAPARDWNIDITIEQEAIQSAASDLRLGESPNALENLQLHINRLKALERKKK